jgi:DNA replication protein DnaC
MIQIGKILPATSRVPRLSVRSAPEYACPVCKDLGFVRRYIEDVNDQRFGTAVKCQCRYLKEVSEARSLTYRWLGAHERYVRRLESKNFDAFDSGANGVSVAQAYRHARSLADKLCRQEDDEDTYNIIFLGPCGIGKTHLACALLNAVREAGIPCLFASGNQLFQALFDSGFDSQVGILRKAMETPLLCLDDLDKMHLRDDGSYQRSTLFDIFNARDLAERPTIVTANKTDEWDLYVHPSLVSRLFGAAEIIRMDGADFRLR